MEKLIQEYRNDMAEFIEMTNKFYNKEIPANQYKGFSGGFGSYAQKGGEASMVRLRLPGGVVTKEKLKFIADKIEQHKISMAHFTTCQTVQVHNLKPEAIFDIIDSGLDVGIICRGGGGDNPRNTMVSPLSGVEQGEYFDVLPYAKAVGDYLVGQIKKIKMPRKLKVCFTNSPKNEVHATFRDCGFVAKENGKFDVYTAGGLGNNHKMGVLVDTDVEPKDVLYYVQAMIETFCAYGDYKNRGRARTRYMQEILGDGYKAAYLEKLEAVKARGGLDIDVTIPEITKAGDGQISGARIIPQKQDGLYAVSYHPWAGTPKPEFFGNLYECIKDMDAVEMRIGPEETVYIINLTAKEAEKVLAVTDDGAKTSFETSVSCVGATICQVGVRDSAGTCVKVLEALRPYDFAEGVLPRFHISGCPSSCGTHQIGKIGFRGGVKKVDGKPVPAFMFYVGGCDHQGQEAFAQEWGAMTPDEIVAFFIDLGKTISAENTTYDAWFTPEKLKEVAQKYL